MRRFSGLRSIRTRLTLWYTGLLLVILLLVGWLSYEVLAWSLLQDVDASLVTVAHVIRDTADAREGGSAAETMLRDLLGPEVYDKFFQFRDREGQPEGRSGFLRGRSLPLSPLARGNARRGVQTLETLVLRGGERVRLLTLPIVREGRLDRLVQVGISLERMESALRRYLHIILALVPVGVGLAAVGGALIARAALGPVNAMARTARRITAEDLSQRIPIRGTGDELDYLAETLNGMLARLEPAFSQMRRFTADAAHELRTPLTALKGGIEVALRTARTPEEYQRVLRESLEEVDRLIRMAEDLLLFSRTAATGSGLPRARVALEPLVLEALETGARLAQGTGVTVRLGAVTPAEVMGDADALRRALRNLVENALKYTPAGGKVELSLAREKDAAVLAVEDSGIGIEPADLERIFEPFVRLDEARSRATGGAGLGLAIARSVATAHGGTLTVQSTPKTGSRFVLRLPPAVDTPAGDS
jgi:heavy metal sensor kinase